MRQIVLDTETTGLEWQQGHRVIEIGCVEIVGRKLTGRRFHCYLNPGREIDPGAQAVHGITAEFLADNPVIDCSKHEVLIPIRIEFKSGEITVGVPEWYIEQVKPEF